MKQCTTLHTGDLHRVKDGQLCALSTFFWTIHYNGVTVFAQDNAYALLKSLTLRSFKILHFSVCCGILLHKLYPLSSTLCKMQFLHVLSINSETWAISNISILTAQWSSGNRMVMVNLCFELNILNATFIFREFPDYNWLLRMSCTLSNEGWLTCAVESWTFCPSDVPIML